MIVLCLAPLSRGGEESFGRPSKRVIAFYYPWYCNPEHDGFYRGWSGHEDKKDGKGRSYPGGEIIASRFYPLRGCSSSFDEADLAAHMKQLRRARVGVICSSWWGVDSLTDKAAAVLLDAAAAAGIKVCFHIEPFNGRTGRNAKNTREAIVYLIDRYGDHEGFYRSKAYGDRPLFFIYDSYLTPADEWATVFSPDGKNTIRGTKYDAVVLGLWVKEDDGRFMLDGHFDGFYTYFATDGFVYGSTTTNWSKLAAWARAHGKLFIPSVGPGYDDLRIRPWNEKNLRARELGAYYDRMFQAAIEVKPQFVSITSFNEWYEGTQIEAAAPKTVKGFPYQDYRPGTPEFYLDRTRSWVERFKR